MERGAYAQGVGASCVWVAKVEGEAQSWGVIKGEHERSQRPLA